MRNKERDYDDYDEDDDSIVDDDIQDITDDEIELDDTAFLTKSHQEARTWRDAEKYKEMMELNKLINDELYIGFDAGKYLRNEEE